MVRGTRAASAVTAIAVLLAATAALVARPAAAAGDTQRIAAAELLILINDERTGHGLAPLVASVPATEIAEAWSGHMAELDDLAHNDEWFAPSTKARMGAGIVGENVAVNRDLADAHRRLMSSPGHRANVLDPRFHQVGIGVVLFGGRLWITEDFFQTAVVASVPTGPPPSAPPQPAPSTTDAPRAVAPPAAAPSHAAVAAPPVPPTSAPAVVAAAADPIATEMAAPALGAGHGGRPAPPGPTRAPMAAFGGMATALLAINVARTKRLLDSR